MRNAAGKLARCLTVAVVAWAGDAAASSPVDRSLNLRAGQFELGLGLGLAHHDPYWDLGVGINFELGYGITNQLELRFRSGLGLGAPGRNTRADRWGRAVNPITHNDGNDTISNPDVGIRVNLVRGGTAEIALDGRVQLPIDGPAGIITGAPIALRLNPSFRLDTGAFLALRFFDDLATDVILPFHFWFKLGGGTFLGPMTGLEFQNDGSTRVPLGFGVGTPLAYDADLRFWVYFPDVRGGGSRLWGLGGGLYVDF